MKNLIKLVVPLVVFISTNSFASTFYWVGGTGNWSDFANHWATTSGGSVFQSQVPSSLDDVVFDGNSFTAVGQSVNIDQTIAFCKNMDWSAVLNTPTFTSSASSPKIKIFGSLTLSQNLIASFSGIMSFEAMTLGNTITSNNNSLKCDIEFNGFNGDWILQDSLVTTKNITINYGILKTNNKNVRCYHFYSSSTNTPGGLSMGTSLFVCTEYWTIYNTTFLLDADSSYLQIFGGGMQTYGPSTWFKYNVIEFSGNNNPSLSGTYNSIKKLIFKGGGNIRFQYAIIDSLFSSGSQLRIENGGHRTINFAESLAGYSHRPDQGDTINKIIVSGSSSITDNSPSNYFNTYGDAIFNDNLTISYTPGHYAKFRKCTIMGDGTISNTMNYFDTLKLNVGHTYTFGSGATQNITKWFDCFGSPGFPIQLVASTFNQQATLNILQPQLCTDYLYMRDMNGTGSSNLYVGANSNNVFNNSGWIFSSCVVGMNEIGGFLFDIFPNPASDYLHISVADNSLEKSIVLCNILGETIYGSNNQLSNQLIIDLRSFPDGLYLLKIKSEQGTAMKKVIIAR